MNKRDNPLRDNDAADNELEFIKYKARGAYHWLQASGHLTKGNAFVKARYQKCMEILDNEAGGLKGKKILDFGCGDGVLAYKLFKSGAAGYGIDSSEQAIELARREHEKRGSNVVFTCSSGYKTDFNDDFFDAVVCSDVIEHIQNPLLLLYEIKRILKPGGTAVISTPIKFTEAPLDKMHVQEWFPLEFQSLVRQVFNDSKHYVSHPLFWLEFLSFSYIHRLAVNLISLWRNPFLSSSDRWQFYSLQYAAVKNEK